MTNGSSIRPNLIARFKPREFEPFDSRTIERKPEAESLKPKTGRKRTHKTNVDLAGKSPDQVLQQFFHALEAWEKDACKAMCNAPTDENGSLIEDQYFAIRASVEEKFGETVEPFVSETFDVGKPDSYGNPAHYGKTGPRIVDVKVSGDNAEISTRGHNMYQSDEPSHVFRLVRYGDHWRVDGVWEITKSGRRKRVKMFL